MVSHLVDIIKSSNTLHSLLLQSFHLNWVVLRQVLRRRNFRLEFSFERNRVNLRVDINVLFPCGRRNSWVVFGRHPCGIRVLLNKLLFLNALDSVIWVGSIDYACHGLIGRSNVKTLLTLLDYCSSLESFHLVVEGSALLWELIRLKGHLNCVLLV